MKQDFLYTGRQTTQISFPLGGIGSGCIGLSGSARLIDWEIYNKPNKRSFNGYSGFAIKAYRGEDLVDARMLNGAYPAPYMGENHRGEPLHSGFGFGPNEKTLAGLPYFEELIFKGEFPIAYIDLKDQHFPGHVTMKAFNPFIPLNDKDSSMPAAFFEIEVVNTGEEVIEYAICLMGGSSFSYTDSQVTAQTIEEKTYIQMGTDTIGKDELSFGDTTLATDAKEVSYQQYWYRGMWKDDVEMFWHDFTATKQFKNRIYEKAEGQGKDMSSLAAHFSVAPGQKEKIRFMITWNYPNQANTWDPHAESTPWKNYYATLFKDSRETAEYGLVNWERLVAETELFHDLLFGSTLPHEVLDAVSANLSVLKSPTCLRLTDGTFYGFEGCIEDKGCCEGSCTHVWNYAYALPMLFPALERSMRDADFKYNQREDGRMSFRLSLPIGSPRKDFHACVDGQMGGVIKAYRDWKISGDDEWLKKNWEAIKKSIAYAWAETNEDQWDRAQTGVIDGRQHHTLDMELFGPNAWLNGFYLAALKAGSEMADYLGEEEARDLYLRLFNQGKAYTDEKLFNGDYFYQQVDLKDRKLLERFKLESSDYWNSETEEIKYQIGAGCNIDQVIAQWHANLCGLGEILDSSKVKQALQSIYRYNYKCMADLANTWRLYSLNDEEGLIICTWPDQETKPTIPLTYNTETMTGFEYQAACHMIQEGLVEEGLKVVAAIRKRYDGERRNPWNEIECGSNYARSMASYSLLLAFSGYQYDGVKKHIQFAPIKQDSEQAFSCFFSCGSGWGQMREEQDRFILEVTYGELELASCQISHQVIQKITLAGEAVAFEMKGEKIHLLEPLKIGKQQRIVIWY